MIFIFFFDQIQQLYVTFKRKSANRQRWLLLGAHLCTFSGRGADGPAEDLLDDVRQQADGDEQDDAEPSRTTGQHLHEDVVHPLVVEEGPGKKEEKEEEDDETKKMNCIMHSRSSLD